MAVPAGFLVLFLAYPLATILGRGILEDGTVRAPFDVLFDARTVEVAWFTAWQAAVSTVLTLAVGLPLAWAVARFDFPGRGLVQAFVLVPFVLPTIVVATAFLALLPPGLERGVPAILIAHVFFNVAVVVRVVGASWAGLDPAFSQAAATLGATPLQRLREITLPLVGPAVSAASALVFLFCFTSFGVVVVLGGPRRATLEVEIYNEAVRAFDLRTASILALLQLVFVALVALVTARLEGRLAGGGVGAVDGRRRPRGPERIAVLAVVGAAATLLLLPPAFLVERSLSTPDGLGLDWYRALADETPALLVEPWRTLPNSLLFAAMAAAIAVVVGGLAAWGISRRRAGGVDALVVLPLGASAVMLGFGYVVAFDEPPLAVRDSIWIVPLVQSLVALPFVVRIVAPALRSIDPRLREAAAVLGAPPRLVWREIDLPITARALAAAGALAFVIALGEFGATVFLARADWPTLPVAIFRFLGRPGAVNAGMASALAVLLMLLATAVVLAIDRLAGRGRTV